MDGTIEGVGGVELVMIKPGKPRGMFLLGEEAFAQIYGACQRREIGALVELRGHATAQAIRADFERLHDIEVIFSGWGAPVMDEAFLAHAARLKAVFYGAGSVQKFVTPAFWQRNIVLSSAYAANAVPVSEYTLATILLSLKHFWHYASDTREQRSYPEQRGAFGAFGSTVGLISLGAIGRLVRERLRPFELHIVAYDPYVSADEAALLDVQLVSLDELFGRSDVVSLHTPWLAETEGMIQAKHFELMKPKATFINTARGAVVREQEMIDVLSQRPDLYAVLDVTYPEPPVAESPLYSLPNVCLTPHIAGSIGPECRRMGQYMVEELRRYLAGRALQWGITEAQAKTMA